MMRTPNLGGRHIAAPTPFQIILRVVLSYTLIVALAALASLAGLVGQS